MIRIREVLRTANCKKFLQDQLQLAEICDLLVLSLINILGSKTIGIFSDSTKQYASCRFAALYLYFVLLIFYEPTLYGVYV